MLENNLIQQIELLQKNLDFLRVLHQEAQQNWEHAQQLATPVTQLLKDEQFSDATERSEKSIVALERAKESLEKIASSEKLSNEAKVEAQQAGLLHVEVLAMIEQLRPLAQRAVVCRDALQNYGDGLTEALQQNNWVLAVEYAQQALLIAPNMTLWQEKYTEAQEQLH